jgi:hypothetical protein
MSSQRGNVARNRPQKYQNQTAFKNDLYNGAAKRALNEMEIKNVCKRCHDVIKWKIKYSKYKPLSAPRTCVRCHQKTVKRAYMVSCEKCVEETKTCAKCLKEPLDGESSEAAGIKGAEIREFARMLPERKRRSLLRFLRKVFDG